MQKFNHKKALTTVSLLIFSQLFSVLISCKNPENEVLATSKLQITVLGTVQDAGYPHINNPSEFSDLYSGNISNQLVTSIAVVDKIENQKWLFEASPNMPQQLDVLERNYLKTNSIIDGIFITHAHIGHYTGLMHFGREAMGAKHIPVYAMPRMKQFLEENGPWSQLVDLNNIDIKKLTTDSTIVLNKHIKVTPFVVPHRDEFSETVGYTIEGPTKKALFIPDINKWSLWEKDLVEEVKKVDYALLDATFFKDGEIPRPMSEVPHPFIEETVELFKNASKEEKSKVIFIHFNHSNPAINENDPNRRELEKDGFQFAKYGMTLAL